MERAVQTLPRAVIEDERKMVLDQPVVSYDTRSMPVTILAPSQIARAGVNARMQLDVLRKPRLTFGYVDESCIRDLRRRRRCRKCAGVCELWKSD